MEKEKKIVILLAPECIPLYFKKLKYIITKHSD